MLIIIMAIFLIQIVYIFIAIFVSGIANNVGNGYSTDETLDYHEIERRWHEEANSIETISLETIEQHFENWKLRYPEASFFWVNEAGMLAVQVDVLYQQPLEWTPLYTAKFMKERYGGDPFTVIAFVGKEQENGFIVLEMPREAFSPPLSKAYDQYGTILLFGMVIIVLLFITVSFLFFRGIRKRLLQLQEAMGIRDVDGLPIQIKVRKDDEIGQLEKTFNQMVVELKESRQREQQEEQLRKELIANLSHDLRTPLTKISTHTYTIGKELLTLEGENAFKSLETSIANMDRLIENLMSYTLLSTSRYTFTPKEIDVIRYVRECFASWYPIFEKEGFEIIVDLTPFEKSKWYIDTLWLNRILDNVWQNVIRHAKSGRYIELKTETTDRYDAILISDRGKGMKSISSEKGAGIGLSIIDMMINGMKLDWDIISNENGTTIKIKKKK